MAMSLRVSTFLVCGFVTAISGAGRAIPAETITVNDPRPLAEVLLQFQVAYGFAVTYEDPRFANPGDLVQVAPRAPTGFRELIPRGGPLSATFEPPAPDADQAQTAAIISSIIDAYHASGYPGRFRVVRGEHMLHVVPVSVLARDGTTAMTPSILDARVSFPSQKGRNMFEGLRAMLVAVGTVTGQRINIGTVPTNLLMQSPMEEGATEVPAREFLERALHGTGRELSWRLLYSADEGFHALNIRIVNGPRAK